MKIAIIGTGNVATILGKLMLRSGHTITNVVGRNKDARERLALQLSSAPVESAEKINIETELHLIAVTDRAIKEVSETLPKNALTVHTSGAIPKDALKSGSSNYGVIYPLQSLRKEMDTLPIIPLFIDGSTDDVRSMLIGFAKTLSDIVQVANDEQRLKLHLAAVLCSNFTNHLYGLTEIFCRKENVDFSKLQPLIEETAFRLRSYSPMQTQTGPAVRGDILTMKKHLQMLEAFPAITNLYKILSESIIKLRDKGEED